MAAHRTREPDETLRDGVKDALRTLGNGFLAHPDNGPLRETLRHGQPSTDAWYQQLLRLAYRILFLLLVEERGLLHSPDASEDAKSRYAQAYGLQRLCAQAVNHPGGDVFSELWENVKIVFQGLAQGAPHLGLPALQGIFATNTSESIDNAKLDNQTLLTAVNHLSRRSAYDFDVEAWGRVYESLLECVPVVTHDPWTFEFAEGVSTKGNARKTTGAYYTPASLVQVLLDSALEPVVEAILAAKPVCLAEALLGLSIVDPACGSGHFLLAAARRLGAHIARLQADGTPTKEQTRHAVQRVITHCLYGVDSNSMAVELCKMTLWIEAAEPGLPLSFLDPHVRHGNALLGTTRALMEHGIPDGAWATLQGDDPEVTRALRRRNRNERAGEDSSPISSKKAPSTDSYAIEKFMADAWCAAFVWPKVAGPLADAAPTNALWMQIRDKQREAPAILKEKTAELSKQYRFFHWEIEFPEVFRRGGFDVVLGNPPWERVKLQEQEFFASRRGDIANAVNAAARKKIIADLPLSDPRLWLEWCAAGREAEGQRHFVRNSGRYPWCSKGDVNMYALFAEHNRSILGPKGRAGFVVPTGIATDETTSDFFADLVHSSMLERLYDFENKFNIFPSVHNSFKFSLLTLRGREIGITNAPDVELCFYARSCADFVDKQRMFSLSAADFALLNPNSKTCPTFRNRRDADINLAMYRRAGILWREIEPGSNPWNLRFLRLLDMANDSDLFFTQAHLKAKGLRLVGNQWHGEKEVFVPLLEAKMIHQFDHRFGSYEGQSAGQANQGKLPELDEAAHANPLRFTQPDCWVNENEVDERLADRWTRRWLLGWRDICRSTDQRTVIAAIVPRVAPGDTFLLAMPSVEPRLIAALVANVCSFALDYAARQKVGGTHLKYHVFKQLPVLAPSIYLQPAPWSLSILLRDWFLPRVLELTYTAWDLQAFGADVGYDGLPFRWDSTRRSLLRAEMDAAYFHLYGISRDDVDYIMETFPTVRKNDEKACGDYRTKRMILEVYDAIAEAVRTGQTYATWLDPGPADARVAHAPRG